VTTGGRIFAYLDAYLDSHSLVMSPQIEPEPVHRRSDLLSLPLEVVQMIVNNTFDDTETIQSVRASCKVLKQLSEKHFRQSYLTHLHVPSTREAFTRLLWTAKKFDLARQMQSITILFDNEDPTLSDTLCSVIHEIEFDPLLRTLHHLHYAGKQIDLIVTIARTPLDNTSSVISIMHRVLDTPLFRSSGLRVRKLFLDIDDTTSPVYPDLKTEEEDRELAEDFGSKFQHIWTRMMETRTLNEIRIRFSKEGESSDSSKRYLRITRSHRGIHVSMRYLTTWHFDIMGRMNIFSDIFSLSIKNCILNSRHPDYLFKNPNLQYLGLWNVGLCNVHRTFDPPTIIQDTESWDDTMAYIAANTTLQSFWAGRLLEDVDDDECEILYTQPWILKATPERSVSQAIFIDHPS
jgi:hypothetical protein